MIEAQMKYVKCSLRMDSIQYGRTGTNQFYVPINRILEKIKSMTITLNGKENSTYEEPMSIDELLSRLNLIEVPVLVELNGIALRKSEFSSTNINDDAIIEIIQIAAGG
jgi:thiamine biosynthesis protein ThiS